MRRALDGWQRFWFEPTPTSTLAVLRIAFGLLATLWTLALLKGLYPQFSSDGILPDQPHFTGDERGAWGILGIFPGKGALVALVALQLVASVCLMLGLLTRLAAAVVFLGVMSFERRNPFVFNSGDGLIRLLAFYLMLAPAGAALSLDRLRRGKRAVWEFPARAPWALRLVQIQVSALYLTAVWDKVQGTTWNDGTAVSYAFRIGDLSRFPLPSALLDSVTAANLLTYGTLAVELSLAVLVWNRALRPWVLLAGIGLHAGIEYTIHVGFYGIAVVIAYIAFLSPEAMSARLLALRRRLQRSRLAPLRRLALEPQPSP